MATYDDRIAAPQVSHADLKRRIQNASREFKTTDGTIRRPKSVGEHFEEEESIAPRALNARYEKKNRNEQQHLQRELANTDDDAERQRLLEEQRFLKQQLRNTSRRADVAGRKLVKTPSMSTFAKGTGLFLVINAYLWAALFSVIALAASAGQSLVLMLKEETWLGKFIGLFVDFEQYVPTYFLAFGFAILSTGVAFIAVLGFTAWFKLTGLNTGQSLFGKLSSYILIAIAILPIINIFPAILIWYVWANLSSVLRRG